MLRGASADSGKPVARYIVPDGMGKTDGLTVIDGRNINAATLKLVDEGLVVIGTHTSPASIADLMIENCY